MSVNAAAEDSVYLCLQYFASDIDDGTTVLTGTPLYDDVGNKASVSVVESYLADVSENY